MPKSAAFQRIKTEVLTVTRAIPAGRVTSFRAIGLHLNVVPRQVAYILATLSDAEKEQTPWYRVVSDNGALERPKFDGYGRSQADLLAAEGVPLEGKLIVRNFDQLFFDVSRVDF